MPTLSVGMGVVEHVDVLETWALETSRKHVLMSDEAAAQGAGAGKRGLLNFYCLLCRLGVVCCGLFFF